MLIVWFQNGWDDQYVEAGGPGSPNFHKSNALKTMRQRPELRGTLLAKGGWDYQLVDELVPEASDIVLPKPRYSGFFNTRSTACCAAGAFVIWSLRALPPTSAWSRPCATAFFLEYFGVVLEDATHQAGPDFAQKAALFNIETFFWLGQ